MQDLFKSIPHKFPAKDKALIEKAIEFATKAHTGQKRKSGEDFVQHPIFRNLS